MKASEQFRPDVFEPWRSTLIWDDDGPESEMLCTFTFAERGKKTEMTFRRGPFTSEKAKKSENEGWNECFVRLEAHVEQM